MRRTTLIALIFYLAAAARAEVAGTPVDYSAGTTTLKGYIATDTATLKKRPGVLVVHEWWGHNDYARKRADMLADMGYTALAVDMYGDGKTAAHPQEAGTMSQSVFKNYPEGKARFDAALALLKSQPEVDQKRIAAIGYCFGGAVVLNMARDGEDLKGVASFHGTLFAVHPAEKGKVKAKILVCHGEKDMFSTPEQIEAFKKEMADAAVDMSFKTYPDAGHSFTNPAADEFGQKFGIPLQYNAAADAASWKDLRSFLKKIFK